MAKLIYKDGKGTKIIEETVFYNNKELAEVDYTETTAIMEFCKIRFKGSSQEYWIESFNLKKKGGSE